MESLTEHYPNSTAISFPFHDLLWFLNPCYEGWKAGHWVHSHICIWRTVFRSQFFHSAKWVQAWQQGSHPSFLSHMIHQEILPVIHPAMFQIRLLFHNLILAFVISYLISVQAFYLNAPLFLQMQTFKIFSHI